MRTVGIRAANSIEADQVSELDLAVQKMITDLMEENGLKEEDLISIIFTATPDIHCGFPATSLRKIGFSTVPLICASEMDVPGAPHLVIRALVTAQKEGLVEPKHIYLGRATALRPDLSK